MQRAIYLGFTLATVTTLAAPSAWAQTVATYAPPPPRVEPTSTWMFAAALTGASLYTLGPASQGALGVELSWNYFPSLRSYFGLGAFVDALGSWSSPASFYGAAGVEVWHTFGGVELGASVQTPGDGYGTSAGLFVGPFVTLGIGFATARLTFPVYEEANALARGFEVNLLFGFKVPFFSSNDRMPEDDSLNPFRNMRFNTRQGRPLRIDGAAPCPPRGAPSTADAWGLDALDEHASIAAFARVSLELMALGAPSRLVADCHRAALDEVRHAEQVLALARRLGHEHAPPALDEALAPMRRADVAALAAESLLDGCLGEALAARLLREGARTALDAAVRDTLARVADDESRHTELAWDIVAWCLTRDPERTFHALAHAAATVSLGEGAARDDGDPDEGRVGTANALALSREVRDEVITRLWSLDAMRAGRADGSARRGAPRYRA